MKTILVLIGGGDRDEVILRTALAVAVPLSAHLDCLHVHVTAAKAARYSRADFAMGTAIGNTLNQLETKAKTFSEIAADHVRAFCAGAKIAFCDTPIKAKNVTASFREETDAEIERLIFHARHSDLVVLGRAKQTQGLAPNTFEHLVLNCGRPVLVAATAAPQTLTDTVMVCWKESANAARAIAAATPILTNAKRVVFTSIVERDDGDTEAVHDLARQFAWSGISTEVRVISADDGEIPDLLAAAAKNCGADLVVMGAYGHSRVRALFVGSCTEALIHETDRPILLMH